MVSEEKATEENSSQPENNTTPSPGQMLRERREALGLSQQQVADKLFLKAHQINDLEEGNYTLNVSDLGGDISCDVSLNYSIGSSEGLTIDDLEITNACSGISIDTGAITVFVSGGDGDYVFQWFEDTNDNEILDPLFDQIVPGGLSTAGGLSFGTYFVQVLEQNNKYLLFCSPNNNLLFCSNKYLFLFEQKQIFVHFLEQIFVRC